MDEETDPSGNMDHCPGQATSAVQETEEVTESSSSDSSTYSNHNSIPAIENEKTELCDIEMKKDDDDSHSVAASHESNEDVLQNILTEQLGARSERHLITSTTGRHYIAHIFEQGADGQPVEPADPEESNMAKTLCLNLLSEFVKGNRKVAKPLISTITQSCEMTEQQEDVVSTQSSTLQKCTHSGENSDHSELTCTSSEPPYKKAKFGWQIKKTKNDENDSDGDSDSSDSYNQWDDESNVKDNGIGMKKSSSFKVISNELDDGDHNEMDTKVSQFCETDGKELEEKSSIECDFNDHQTKHVINESTAYQTCLSDEGSKSTLPVDIETLHESSNTSEQDNAMQSDAHINSEQDPDDRLGSHALDRIICSGEPLMSQHIAKSIVDNAINKTLEEMGLSPDVAANRARQQYTNQRMRVEDVGVAEVIRERGLQGYTRNLSSFPSLHGQPPQTQPPQRPANNNSQRLIISRLAEASENMFVQSVRHGLRVSARIDLGAVTGDANPILDDNAMDNVGNAEAVEEDTEVGDTLDNFDVSESASISDHDAEIDDFDPSEDMALSENASADIEQIEKECLSSSYVLDRALNAAITERGLHF